jgi:CRP-like cAMP-binding protein
MGNGATVQSERKQDDDLPQQQQLPKAKPLKGEEVAEFATRSNAALSPLHKELLRNAFSRLSASLSVTFDLEQLEMSAKVLYAAPSAIIFEKYKKIKNCGIYMVVEGLARVIESGHEDTGIVVLEHLTTGDIFGELETFLNCSCCMTIIAAKKTTLVYLSKNFVMSCISSDATIDRRFMKKWIIQRAYINTNLFNKTELTLSIALQALKTSVIFESWGQQSLEFIANSSQLTLFDSGTNLIKVNEPSSHFFILVRGEVDFRADSSASSATIEHIKVNLITECVTIGAADFFGQKNREHSVIVLAPSLILLISRETIMTALDKFSFEKQLYMETLQYYS